MWTLKHLEALKEIAIEVLPRDKQLEVWENLTGFTAAREDCMYLIKVLHEQVCSPE
jgi:hypothetical protein